MNKMDTQNRMAKAPMVHPDGKHGAYNGGSWVAWANTMVHDHVKDEPTKQACMDETLRMDNERNCQKHPVEVAPYNWEAIKCGVVAAMRRNNVV